MNAADAVVQQLERDIAAGIPREIVINYAQSHIAALEKIQDPVQQAIAQRAIAVTKAFVDRHSIEE